MCHVPCPLYAFQLFRLCLFKGLEFLDLPIDVFLGFPFEYACNTLYTDLFATISCPLIP